jgi:methyl-accepting chemotaxis protein
MLKNMMRSVFIAIGLCIALALLTVLYLGNLAQTVDKMANIRYWSYQAGDELRQSSDDLTRLGRTYVVSGDEKYEKMYMDILDIRNGKKPRPENYHTIYWDLVLEYGQKPKADGKRAALLDRMKDLGFTDSEFRLLEEATANSDALVNMEVKAMNAVKGLFPDSSGNYTIHAEPDSKMAIELLHSTQYHIEKAKIVAPIEKFFEQLETRTQQQFESASSEVKYLVIVSNVLLSLVFVVGAVGYLIVSRKITGRITRMADRLRDADKNNDLTVRVDTTGSNEISNIGKGINSLMSSYSTTIRKINEVNSSIEAISNTIKEISDENITLSEKQMLEIEMAATAMEEMTTALASVSENTCMAEKHAADTQTAADSGKKVFDSATREFRTLETEFDQTAQTINELASETNNVGNVLAVIKGIADQTNLLALNAAIEAARAGEQGRGFAVVADEVRSLAKRTQESTIEIENMISSLQQKAEQSTLTIKHSSEKMKSASGNISNANDALMTIHRAASEIYVVNSTIAAATEEQLSVSAEISRNLVNVKGNSRDIANKIEKLGPTVTHMGLSVNELRKTVAHLTVTEEQ